MFYIEQVQMWNRGLRDERVVYTGVFSEFPCRESAEKARDEQFRATGVAVPVETD